MIFAFEFSTGKDRIIEVPGISIEHILPILLQDSPKVEFVTIGDHPESIKCEPENVWRYLDTAIISYLTGYNPDIEERQYAASRILANCKVSWLKQAMEPKRIKEETK